MARQPWEQTVVDSTELILCVCTVCVLYRVCIVCVVCVVRTVCTVCVLCTVCTVCTVCTGDGIRSSTNIFNYTAFGTVQ